MKTKKVQRRRRKTLQRRRKTLRMHGGENSITFLVNDIDKCTFTESNKIFVKRGQKEIGFFEIDEENIKYKTGSEYDLGKISSSTPYTLTEQEQVNQMKATREQSQANQLQNKETYGKLLSYGKSNPAGVDIRNRIEYFKQIEEQRQQRKPPTIRSIRRRTYKINNPP